MANEPQLSVAGNLVAEPELRFTQAGKPVATFKVADTPRTFDRASGQWKDGETLFMRCTAWGEMGEAVAQLTKGTRIVATGLLKSRTFDTKEGEKRTMLELEVEDVGPSLKFAKAQASSTPVADWNNTASDFGGNLGDEPPF